MNNTPLLLQSLKSELVDRPPVWLMRQAGRYLPEYRAMKEKYSFLELCRSSELALEISLQPVRTLDIDAAIVFADILLPAEGMGLNIDFNPGPHVANPIKSSSDIENLSLVDPYKDLKPVLDTISSLKKELTNLAKATKTPRKAVIGFAGAPWTMACYLIDQGLYKHFHGTQVFAQQNPNGLALLLDKLTEVVSDYLVAQVEHGADAVQLFDTWGGNLSYEDYCNLSLPYIRTIFDKVSKTGCPTILYLNGSAHLLPAMRESGADCLSLDWRTEMSTEQQKSLGALAIQGNFDPTHLFGSKEHVINRTKWMLESVDFSCGYIANLGHGVLPKTPVENVQAFVNTIKEFGKSE